MGETMKRAACALVVFVSVLASTTLFAASVTDQIAFGSAGITTESSDTYADAFSYGWGAVNFLNGTGDWISWTHAFAPVIPANVTGATLAVTLRDDASDAFFSNEYALGWTESGQWAVGEVNTGTYSYNVNFAYLADGRFEVTLASLGGDFYVDSSSLNITYNSSGPVSVPEPSLLLFLGIGLVVVGVVVWRRKHALH
jgi:hypothetical protein